MKAAWYEKQGALRGMYLLSVTWKTLSPAQAKFEFGSPFQV